MENVKKNQLSSLCAMASFFIWGLFPLYWKFLQDVPPGIILANRIVWSFALTFPIIFLNGNLKELRRCIKERDTILYASLASMFISINWGSYIFAVNSGRVVETSLGYYINPLMLLAMGVFIFKESLDKLQVFSLFLASIGVFLLTLMYGHFPWLSVVIALSFSLYSICKKKLRAGSLTGLILETAFLFPFALAYLIKNRSSGSFGSDVDTMFLLIGSGAVTSIPLFLFSKGAQGAKLSTIAFLQYITPTISLALGIFLYREEFNKTRAVSFAFIWFALAVYSVGLLRKARQKQHAVQQVS